MAQRAQRMLIAAPDDTVNTLRSGDYTRGTESVILIGEAVERAGILGNAPAHLTSAGVLILVQGLRIEALLEVLAECGATDQRIAEAERAYGVRR